MLNKRKDPMLLKKEIKYYIKHIKREENEEEYLKHNMER